MSLRLFSLECLMHKFNIQVIIQSAENSIQFFFASSDNDDARNGKKNVIAAIRLIRFQTRVPHTSIEIIQQIFRSPGAKRV